MNVTFSCSLSGSFCFLFSTLALFLLLLFPTDVEFLCGHRNFCGLDIHFCFASSLPTSHVYSSRFSFDIVRL